MYTKFLKISFPFLSLQSLKEERRHPDGKRLSICSDPYFRSGKLDLGGRKEIHSSNSPRLSQGESRRNPCGGDHRLYWLWCLRSTPHLKERLPHSWLWNRQFRCCTNALKVSLLTLNKILISCTDWAEIPEKETQSFILPVARLQWKLCFKPH